MLDCLPISVQYIGEDSSGADRRFSLSRERCRYLTLFIYLSLSKLGT